MAFARHTTGLRYSRLERLHFRIFRRWPQRVVDRRLLAADLDEAELERRIYGDRR
jgi:hypothetical protein